jgi:hypothetical protein
MLPNTSPAIRIVGEPAFSMFSGTTQGYLLSKFNHKNNFWGLTTLAIVPFKILKHEYKMSFWANYIKPLTLEKSKNSS